MGPLVVKSPNYLNNCLCMYIYIYSCADGHMFYVHQRHTAGDISPVLVIYGKGGVMFHFVSWASMEGKQKSYP